MSRRDGPSLRWISVVAAAFIVAVGTLVMWPVGRDPAASGFSRQLSGLVEEGNQLSLSFQLTDRSLEGEGGKRVEVDLRVYMSIEHDAGQVLWLRAIQVTRDHKLYSVSAYDGGNSVMVGFLPNTCKRFEHELPGSPIVLGVIEDAVGPVAPDDSKFVRTGQHTYEHDEGFVIARLHEDDTVGGRVLEFVDAEGVVRSRISDITLSGDLPNLMGQFEGAAGRCSPEAYAEMVALLA